MKAVKQRKMIIHAGFHKTGTSTVQAVLKAHRERLAPHVSVILKTDMPALCQAALAYSNRPAPPQLTAFQAEAASHFTDASDDTRPVLISAEDLCGMFPGRRGRIGYPQAKTLLQALADTIKPAFVPHVYLSTRGTDTWLQSCYAHNLRHARMRMSFREFVAAHQGPSLQEVADDIASGLSGMPVTTARLEKTTGMAEGPLTPILDLFDLPSEIRAHLKPTKVANPSLPPDIQAAFLLLNRSEDDDEKRNTAKKQVIAAYRSGRK